MSKLSIIQWNLDKNKSRKFFKYVPTYLRLYIHTFRDAIRIATEQFRQELTEEITQKIFEGTMGNMELTDGNLELPEWEIGKYILPLVKRWKFSCKNV